jgi:hypothetical protein
MIGSKPQKSARHHDWWWHSPVASCPQAVQAQPEQCIPSSRCSESSICVCRHAAMVRLPIRPTGQSSRAEVYARRRMRSRQQPSFPSRSLRSSSEVEILRSCAGGCKNPYMRVPRATMPGGCRRAHPPDRQTGTTGLPRPIGRLARAAAGLPRARPESAGVAASDRRPDRSDPPGRSAGASPAPPRHRRPDRPVRRAD